MTLANKANVTAMSLPSECIRVTDKKKLRLSIFRILPQSGITAISSVYKTASNVMFTTMNFGYLGHLFFSSTEKNWQIESVHKFANLSKHGTKNVKPG